MVKMLEHDKEDEFGDILFRNEITMYNEVIPHFEKALREAGDDTVIGGKCLFTDLKPCPILIFEDLTKRNYQTVSHWCGDWNMTQRAIDKLARWHAVSHKSFIERHDIREKLKSNFYTSDKMPEFTSYKIAYQTFLDMLEETPDLVRFAPKFKKIVDDQPLMKIQNIFKASFSESNANFWVLLHSDFHIKNFMYLNNDLGEIEDVKLVDFQLCIWGPAAIDLMFLIYMALDSDSRLRRRNEIVHYYYEVLIQTLEKLNFKGQFPKLTDIYKDMITFKDFGRYEYCFFKIDCSFFVLLGRGFRVGCSSAVHSNVAR